MINFNLGRPNDSRKFAARQYIAIKKYFEVTYNLGSTSVTHRKL